MNKVTNQPWLGGLHNIHTTSFEYIYISCHYNKGICTVLCCIFEKPMPALLTYIPFKCPITRIVVPEDQNMWIQLKYIFIYTMSDIM